MNRMEVKMSYMFESLSKAGHVEVVSIQSIAQNFNSLFLQLLYDLKKQNILHFNVLYAAL